MRIYARDQVCAFRLSLAEWGAFSNFQPLAVPIAAGPWSFGTSEAIYQAAKFAEVGECPRSARRLDLHNRYPGFESPLCLMPMRQVSSRPDTAPGGARFPGRLRDKSETAGRHDPGGANQSVRRRQQRHGLAAGRLVARSGRGRATARRREQSAGAPPRWRMDDRV